VGDFPTPGKQKRAVLLLNSTYYPVPRGTLVLPGSSIGAGRVTTILLLQLSKQNHQMHLILDPIGIIGISTGCRGKWIPLSPSDNSILNSMCDNPIMWLIAWQFAFSTWWQSVVIIGFCCVIGSCVVVVGIGF